MTPKKRPVRARPKSPARARKRAAKPRTASQHRPELIGLGLVALGLFLAAILWAGWDGGLVRGGIAGGFRAGVGWASYVTPLAFVAVGALMVGRSALVEFRPFRAGEALVAVGLVVALGADHGGWVGKTLSHGLGALLGGTGTFILGVLALLVGALLLSGASL